MIRQASRQFLGCIILMKLCIGFAGMLLVVSHPCKAEEIPLKREGGVYALNVLVNDNSILKFILDSGASTTSISSAEFLVLMKNGTIGRQDILSDAVYTMADGREVKQRRVVLRKLQVGSVIVRDVEATVTSDPTSGLLLGQSFLKRLPGWGLNNERSVLVITGVKKPVPASKITPDRRGTASYSEAKPNLFPGHTSVVETATFASAPKHFFQAIVAKDYATAWGLLSEKSKKSLVATSAKEAEISDDEMRKLFDSNDPAIQNGFWEAFRGSCKADVFIGFSYTYGRQLGAKHIVELRRPGADSDKPLELEVYDEGGPKFGMAESFKL